MEADLRALLLSDSALVAAAPGGVQWDRFSQGTEDPAVRLSYVDGEEGLTMQGGDGLNFARVRVGVRGKLLSAVWAVRDRITALHGYRGTVGETYFSQVAAIVRALPHETTDTGDYYFRVIDLEIWSRAAS